jgi:hypothetical protein
LFLGVVVLSFLVAWLRGGRLKEDLNLRLMWLAPAALILQTASKYFFPMSIQGAATVLSYAMLIAFALTNMGNLGVRLIFIGMLLNALVIAANLGHMPVHLDMARSLGIGVKQIESGPWGKHQALTDEHRGHFRGNRCLLAGSGHDGQARPAPLGRCFTVKEVSLLKNRTMQHLWALLFTVSVLAATVSSWTIGTIK